MTHYAAPRVDADIDISPARHGDAADVAPLFDLYRQFYDAPSDLGTAEHFIRERIAAEESIVLLARSRGDGSRVVGFAQLYPAFSSLAMRPTCTLNDLFVAEEWRDRGIGRRLIEEAAGVAIARGAARLDIATGNANHRARALYESMGFVADVDFTHLSLPLEPVIANHAPTADASATPTVFELRQYTHRPGARDVLIDLFERVFIEAQEDLGMKVVGHFRNADDPNAFVWLRGFADMESRARALTDFYDGAVWQAHRSVANPTLLDNDNVLLLRAAGFALDAGVRPSRDAVGDGPGMVTATIYHLDPGAAKEAEFVAFFRDSIAPLLARAGAPVIASFVVERAPNTYPRLPVREGAHVFVWFASFESQAAHERSLIALDEAPDWRNALGVELTARVREPHTLRLIPCARSLIHG